MKTIIHKHPLAIRWCHWVNFPVLFVMIWSGLMIYWADRRGEYYVPVPVAIANSSPDWLFALGDKDDAKLIVFFPEWFYRIGTNLESAIRGNDPDAEFTIQPSWLRSQLNLARSLPTGMGIHFTFMWIFALNGLLYVTYVAVSGEWRHLLPSRRSFGEAWDVFLHDLYLRRGPLPRRKFNGAQQFAYTGVVLMGAGSLITGLAIYKPTQLAWLTSLLGGYEAARFEHFALTIGYVGFFFVHVIQVIRAGWNNFRAMVTGYEVVEVESGNG